MTPEAEKAALETLHELIKNGQTTLAFPSGTEGAGAALIVQPVAVGEDDYEFVPVGILRLCDAVIY
jgi:hypothetical protein